MSPSLFPFTWPVCRLTGWPMVLVAGVWCCEFRWPVGSGHQGCENRRGCA